MMKNLLCITLALTLFQSCKDIDLDLVQEVSLLNKIQGNYSSCEPSLAYSGYYGKIAVEISGKNMTLTESTHSNSDCSDTTGPGRTVYKIVSLAKSVGDPDLIEADLEYVSYEFRPDLAWYVSQNYCGLTDWVLGVYRDITGLSCPSFLAADTHHTAIRSQGEAVYSSIKLTSSGIEVISGYTESGDSPAERHVTDLVPVQRN